MRALVSEQDKKMLTERGQVYRLPNELGGEDMRRLVVTAQKLRTRVLDPALRAATGEFINICTRDSTDLKDHQPDDATRHLTQKDVQAATAYVQLAEHLGEHLRAELDRILVDQIDRLAPDSV